MYVWGRLLRTWATARSRGHFRAGEETSLSFHCLPGDVDINRHLNNARYLMLADLGRIDFFIRSGLVEARRSRGWVPLMGGVQAVFVREIRLWARFKVISSLEAWHDLQMLGTHRFVLENGETAALIMTAAGVYDRRAGRFLPIADVLQALGYSEPSRPLSEDERSFLHSHAALRSDAKGRG